MPLSKTPETQVQDQHKREDNTNHKKRRHSSNNRLSPTHLQANKKIKEDSPTMTDSQKRANFSALSSPSNGLNKHTSPLMVNKPGATKKLVIKNFKGKTIIDPCDIVSLGPWELFVKFLAIKFTAKAARSKNNILDNDLLTLCIVPLKYVYVNFLHNVAINTIIGIEAFVFRLYVTGSTEMNFLN